LSTKMFKAAATAPRASTLMLQKRTALKHVEVTNSFLTEDKRLHVFHNCKNMPTSSTTPATKAEAIECSWKVKMMCENHYWNTSSVMHASVNKMCSLVIISMPICLLRHQHHTSSMIMRTNCNCAAEEQNSCASKEIDKRVKQVLLLTTCTCNDTLVQLTFNDVRHHQTIKTFVNFHGCQNQKKNQIRHIDSLEKRRSDDADACHWLAGQQQTACFLSGTVWCRIENLIIHFQWTD